MFLKLVAFVSFNISFYVNAGTLGEMLFYVSVYMALVNLKYLASFSRWVMWGDWKEGRDKGCYSRNSKTTEGNLLVGKIVAIILKQGFESQV